MTFLARPPRVTRPLWWVAVLFIAAGAALALMTACAGNDGIEVTEHRASINPGNSLIAEVQVSLSGEAQIFIDYENPEAGKFRTALSQPGTDHAIPIVRLRPESVYAYAIGIQESNGGMKYGPSGEFTTGPLPPYLAAAQIRIGGRSTLPLIATDNWYGDNAYYLFWDETGTIVWYYTHQNVDGLDLQGKGLQTIKQKPNGNLVYVSRRCCLTEITPLGDLVDQIVADGGAAGIPHHDFIILDDNRILFPSFENLVIDDSANGGAAETDVIIDQLLLWDQQNGNIEQVWYSRDFWDLTDPGQRVQWSGDIKNWTHINSISLGQDGNYILNSRNRNQIISLSQDFRTIEWQLAGPDSDYSFPNPNDRFYRQHAATQLPNGNILLFDNGRMRPESEGGEYSRALELHIDNDNRTATKVWEYRSDPDIFSPGISSAFRLNNGNTLVNFGLRKHMLIPAAFVEADPQGNDVFRIEILHQEGIGGVIRYSFRASGDIDSIMGETMLRPPAARPPSGRDASGDWRWWPVQEMEARLANSQPLARERFDLYLDANRLVYRKEQCAAADVADSFLLHVFPSNPDDLPDESRELGFENLYIDFQRQGIIRDGKCLVAAPLPDYPIARIRAGQFVSGGEQLWVTEFPIP